MPPPGPTRTAAVAIIDSMTWTIRADVLARVKDETDQQGVTVAEWLAHAARVAEGLAAAEETLAEIRPVDQRELERISAALDRAEARQAARHHPAA
jgi:hypothetical protein